MTTLQFPNVRLSPEETLRLVVIAQSANEPEAGRARRLVFLGHLRLVQQHAHRMARRTGIDREDLFQEGCIALGEAITHFDASKGSRFLTYAYVAVARRVTHSAHLLLSPRQAWLALDETVADEAATRSFERVEASLGDLLHLLPAKAARLLAMRYGVGGPEHTLEACAAEFGCSVSTVSRWERQALDAARALIERPPVEPVRTG